MKSTQQYDLQDLLKLMQRLRDPETGCPWDIKQDFLSITPYTIEEVYEVVEAIEKEDFDELPKELGDLLFQVVFYSQLGSERDLFDFDAVVHSVTEKLLRRHPHVFPDGTLNSFRDLSNSHQSEQVEKQWDEIKAQERKSKGQHNVFDDVPSALPSLQRATKLQKRAKKLGLDWQNAREVLDALEEEVSELKQAMRENDPISMQDELGDVLFSCVNLARHLSLDADQSLRQANAKFVSRVERIDETLKQSGENWPADSPESLDKLWQQSKTEG